MARNTITIRDNNQHTEWLKKQLKILSKSVINIGILGSEDAKIIMIASVNEFGAEINVTDKMRGFLASQGLYLKRSTTEIKIPERSFIRRTADEKQRMIVTFIQKQYDKLFRGEINANQLLDAIGVYCEGITKKTLVDLTEPANHPFTLARKSPKTNPLVNTGTLVGRISFEVKKR